MAVVSLSCVNQCYVQFLPRYGDFLSFAIGERCKSLFMKSDSFTKSTHSCKCYSLVRFCTSYVEFHPITLYRVCFDGPIKESQCLIILT